MKKFFTLIAAALMTMGVNAQTWNFSEWAEATYEEATVVNGLKINAESGKAITIDANSKTVDGVEYTKRLKLGGTGSPTQRNIGFTASAAGTLKIIATSSSSGTDRSLEIALDGTAIGTIPAKGGVVEAGTVTITAAGEVTIYSPSSGVNMYLVEFSAAGSGPEVWDASTLDLSTITTRQNSGDNLKTVPTQYPGEAPSNEQIIADATAPLTLTDYIFTVNTPSVTLTGVSTPNSDKTIEEAWRFMGPKANAALANLAMNTDDCPIKWENYVQSSTGNPSFSAIEYFFTNSEGKSVGPRYIETYWEPTSTDLPAKGEYFEFTFAKAGTFMGGFFLNRPSSNMYVLEKESKTLIPASNMSIKGFVQNNGYTWDEGASGPFAEFSFNEDYTVNVGNAGNRQLLVYVTFPVEAKTYLMFNPKNQLGIYGFQFTPGGTTGIETVKTQKAFSADAPMYNMAGQKVDKSYKGIVIQNGRKFYNK